MSKSKSVAESLNAVVKTHLVTMSEQYNVYAKAILEMEDKIRALKQFMLSQDFLNNIKDIQDVNLVSTSVNKKPKKEHKKENKKENKIISDISVQHENNVSMSETEVDIDVDQSPKLSFFSPKQKNSLLWCFYIIVNGLSGYEYEKNYFTAEQEFKVKTI